MITAMVNGQPVLLRRWRINRCLGAIEFIDIDLEGEMNVFIRVEGDSLDPFAEQIATRFDEIKERR